MCPVELASTFGICMAIFKREVMVSTLNSLSPSNRNTSPTKTDPSILKLPFFNSNLKSASSLRLPCFLLVGVILQFLLLSFFFRHPEQPPPTSQTQLESPSRCKYGTVFVYDLPPMFNKDVVDNCQELDPWHNRCNIFTNGGFGPHATGLETVVPENLLPAWYWTDMYISEVIYHRRLMNYTCKTNNQEKATAFYVPFYAGLAVAKYLWFNYTAKERDRHGEMVLDWLKDQPSWKRNNGADHFIVFGRLTWAFRRLTDDDSDWGSKFILMPLMKNVLKLSVEKSPWDESEVSIPYPTAFHPRSKSDISEWQNYVGSQNRTNLFCFVGASRTKIKNDFRGILMNYCKSESGFCRAVDCSVTPCENGSPKVLEAFLGSDFCLQPRGDGATRRSFFDCMLAGSIPVYFWRDSFEGQYQWHVKANGMDSSVFIDQSEVRNESSIIRKVLEGYSREQVKKMRGTVIDMIPRFLYSLSSEGLPDVKDAFDVAIEGVLRSFRKQSLHKVPTF